MMTLTLLARIRVKRARTNSGLFNLMMSLSCLMELDTTILLSKKWKM